jgi:hypothetical protein
MNSIHHQTLVPKFGGISSLETLIKLWHPSLVRIPSKILSPNFGVKVWWRFHLGTFHQTLVLKFDGMPRFGYDSLFFVLSFLKILQTLFDLFHCVFANLPLKKKGSCDYKHPMTHPQAPWWTQLRVQRKIVEKERVGAHSLAHNTLGVEGRARALVWGLGRLTSKSIIRTNLHNPNNKLVNV